LKWIWKFRNPKKFPFAVSEAGCKENYKMELEEFNNLNRFSICENGGFYFIVVRVGRYSSLGYYYDRYDETIRKDLFAKGTTKILSEPNRKNDT